ncbi:hypothetical protein F4813DRAFT_392960 [Daldinia decipiens]|uniref:uncharacterized protein n=1 Tax=Daldinia decipiens TaxID=326647 RepID=UPI0020C5B221|nr:uncharacterized protein F4813DRAFT_392960 [Daldinia decipiens]KAI1654217.1 hypothetical protein F4813DRAFT_392960 [Daldinia decipiens]
MSSRNTSGYSEIINELPFSPTATENRNQYWIGRLAPLRENLTLTLSQIEGMAGPSMNFVPGQVLDPSQLPLMPTQQQGLNPKGHGAIDQQLTQAPSPWLQDPIFYFHGLSGSGADSANNNIHVGTPADDWSPQGSSDDTQPLVPGMRLGVENVFLGNSFLHSDLDLDFNQIGQPSEFIAGPRLQIEQHAVQATPVVPAPRISGGSKTDQLHNEIRSIPKRPLGGSAGLGPKRKVSAASELNLGPIDSGLGPRQKKQRTVRNNSCSACRKAKVKCELREGSLKCTRCGLRDTDCIITGVDKRTNESKHKELLGAIEIYHGLVLEFSELLCLLSPDKNKEPEGKEARELYEKGLSPTEILSRLRRTPKRSLILEVKELRQYDRGYEKLEDIRVAITKVKESGLRVLCSLHNACDEALRRAMDAPGVKLALEEARSGAFHLQGRHTFKEKFLKGLYRDGFMPAPATLQLFR